MQRIHGDGRCWGSDRGEEGALTSLIGGEEAEQWGEPVQISRAAWRTKEVHCNESYNTLMKAYCTTKSTIEALELENRMLELVFPKQRDMSIYYVWALEKH